MYKTVTSVPMHHRSHRCAIGPAIASSIILSIALIFPSSIARSQSIYSEGDQIAHTGEHTIARSSAIDPTNIIDPVRAIAQNNVSVRVKRWISVQQTTGNVTYTSRQTNRPARVGDRLAEVGDTITTGANSSATLLVDTGVGTINVLPNTEIRIRDLSVAPDNGQISRLTVPKGQVRLKLRTFTNRGSQFEIQTPAGLSGVRGTEFGVIVQPDGRTSVATLEGSVTTSAQGVEVAVPAGTQNFTIPGEPPSNAVALVDNPYLNYRFERTLENGIRRLTLVGQIDPVNAVQVEGQSQPIDRTGQFRVRYYAPSFLRIHVLVTTPLGKTQTYEIAPR